MCPQTNPPHSLLRTPLPGLSALAAPPQAAAPIALPGAGGDRAQVPQRQEEGAPAPQFPEVPRPLRGEALWCGAAPSRPGRPQRLGLLLPPLLFLRPPRLGKWEVAAAACVCARVRGAAERSLRVPPRRQRHCERRARRGRICIGLRRRCGAANKEEEPRREVGRGAARGAGAGRPSRPRRRWLGRPPPLRAGPSLSPSTLGSSWARSPDGAAASLPSPGRKLPGLRAAVSRGAAQHSLLSDGSASLGTPASSPRRHRCFPKGGTLWG